MVFGLGISPPQAVGIMSDDGAYIQVWVYNDQTEEESFVLWYEGPSGTQSTTLRIAPRTREQVALELPGAKEDEKGWIYLREHSSEDILSALRIPVEIRSIAQETSFTLPDTRFVLSTATVLILVVFLFVLTKKRSK